VPHWLIDIVDPQEPFDAAAFVDVADRVIADIAARGKRVIVVGGTGLYIRTLLWGVHGGPAANPEFRAELGGRAAEVGWPAIHRELAEVDPASADRLHPNDGVRILRALEVFHLSGKTMSAWQQEHGFASARYPHLYLALERPREQLRKRVALRVDRMMEDGFLDEVRGLLSDGFPSSLKPMQGLGYKRLCQHLEGELSLDDAIAKIKTDTSRFAKRQMTWFKGERDVVWAPCVGNAIEERAAQWFAGQPGST
jgi:tRNA dimethylallyltransferase